MGFLPLEEFQRVDLQDWQSEHETLPKRDLLHETPLPTPPNRIGESIEVFFSLSFPWN